MLKKWSESVSHSSHVQILVTPRTVACQAPLSLGFPGQNTEWVAIPFSRGSSWPRGWTQVSCSAGRFFIIWATREAPRVMLIPAKSGSWQVLSKDTPAKGGVDGFWARTWSSSGSTVITYFNFFPSGPLSSPVTQIFTVISKLISPPNFIFLW